MMTVPQQLLENARSLPETAIALRQKRYGIWQEIGWREYAERMVDTARGLLACGLERGDRVAIIAANRKEWLYAELGAQAVGAISVGVYIESTEAEIQYVVNLCECSVVFADDQEQVDKLLALGDAIPSVRKIVYFEPKGLQDYRDPRVVHLDAMWAALDPKLNPASDVELMIGQTRSDAVALLAHLGLLGGAGAPAGWARPGPGGVVPTARGSTA